MATLQFGMREGTLDDTGLHPILADLGILGVNDVRVHSDSVGIVRVSFGYECGVADISRGQEWDSDSMFECLMKVNRDYLRDSHPIGSGPAVWFGIVLGSGATLLVPRLLRALRDRTRKHV